jgi:diguanylate cyclase (GGDEF)-like protein
MATPVARVQRHDLVPLSDRVRWMRWFRLGLVAGVLAFAVTAGDARLEPLGTTAIGTLAYVLLILGLEGIWHWSGRRALFLVSAMLIADGVFLTLAGYAAGGSLGGARMLVIVHLIGVSLLASYRTGMKIAMWHSLLLFTVHSAQQVGILEVPRGVSGLAASEDSRLFALIAILWVATFATATFSAVNERELRRRRYDLEALSQFATALDGAADSFDVAQVLLDRVAETFEVERLLLLGAPKDELVLLARRGSTVPIGSAISAGIGSVLVRTWDARETQLVPALDAETDQWLDQALPDARNLIITPLSAEGRAVGTLIVEHGPRRAGVERRVVTMIERFAGHASLALQNAWLLEQVQQAATTDGLTGIANRRTFDTVFERELSRAARTGDPLSLLMMDLDSFKPLNDTYGHQMGDDVLRAVAAALQGACRDFDTVARYGGEEFAVVMPGCGLEEATRTAERLRQVVGSCEAEVPVTTSVGVASFPEHGVDSRELLKAADDALYRSKRAGRNRVTTADQGEDPAATLRVLP